MRSQLHDLLHDPISVFGPVEDSEKELDSFFCEDCGCEVANHDKKIVWNEASPKQCFFECCPDCAPKKHAEVNTKFIPFQLGTQIQHFNYIDNLYKRSWER